MATIKPVDLKKGETYDTARTHEEQKQKQTKIKIMPKKAENGGKK